MCGLLILADLLADLRDHLGDIERSARAAEFLGEKGVEDKIQSKVIRVLERAKTRIEQALDAKPEPPV